mgnify:CR=1 FL=1
MAQFDVYSTAVENIIGWIRSGEVAIPEIQRPFVWDGSKVRDLMDSLYKGFPVGYIIVWKNPDIKLKDGKIAAGKKVLIGWSATYYCNASCDCWYAGDGCYIQKKTN